MTIEKQSLLSDLPEHHHTIRHLKMHSRRFGQLLEKYDHINNEIYQQEIKGSGVPDESIEEQKKQRLHLKDQLFDMIRQEEAAQSS